MLSPLLLAILSGPLAGSDGRVDFVREVRPLLADRCFKCHGPDAGARKADLRLDVREVALAAGVIVPGDAAASPLVARIHADEGERMPPVASKLELTGDERALLVRWISEGAEYAEHWARRAPARPDPPQVVDGAWPRDPLDRFVLARLEQAGLQPAPETARATWLRRASFVLTGLPPTLEELDAFLADDAPGAHQRQADRLLASPRYGERMAADWLDVARYADTYGYQSDVYREVWPWRDWVVRAFDQNLPYDEFVTWQLAGDLLPEPTSDQVLATAFNRLHRQTNEGGSTEEEYRVEYVSDRVHTFGTAFLGLTLECARCHDHKYDPLAQREYYGLAAFFANIDESGLYSHFTDAVPTPVVELPTEEQAAALAEADRLLAAQPGLGQLAFDQPAFAAWRGRLDPSAALPGLAGHYAMDEGQGADLAAGVEGRAPGHLHGQNRRCEGRQGGGIELTGDDPLTFPEVGGYRRWDPFSLALWLRPGKAAARAVVLHRSKAWHDSGSRGYQLLLEDGRPSFSLIHFWPGDALRVRALAPLPVGEWSHVAVTYDGSSRAEGVGLHVDGTRVPVEVVRDGLARMIVRGAEGALTIGERFRDNGFSAGRVDELVVVDRELAPLEVAGLARGPGVYAAAGPEALRAVFRARPDDGPAEAARQRLRELRRQRGETRDAVRAVMAMRELPEPRATYRLVRGDYTQRAERVAAGTPAFLPPLAPAGRADRLALARWLLRPEHPLTSRVAANRLWQLAFGAGLVATAENFGVQGSPPSHPRLLDHLAISLMDSGWDVQALLRRLVLSATFRQSSRAGSALLGAWPAPRLPAEMLRDQALAAGGLLVERVGGPSVRPYQPAGLWKEKSGQTYTPDTGEGLYRRSLYTIWKRTSPPPAMMILDAAKRDVCVARRQATSSPLQALLLANDPQYVEAGRALAERALREREGDAARVAHVFRILTARGPSAAEARVLLDLLADLVADYGADPDQAAAALAVGARPAPEDLDRVQLASWSLLATTLLSHHEAICLR